MQISYRYLILVYRRYSSYYSIKISGKKINISWVAVATSETWWFSYHKVKINPVFLEKKIFNFLFFIYIFLFLFFFDITIWKIFP
jgi:hypothetical protein